MHCHSDSTIRTTCNKVLRKRKQCTVILEHIAHFSRFLSTAIRPPHPPFFVSLYSVPSPSITTCTYLTFISPFSVSFISIAISFNLSSVLSFRWRSSFMHTCEEKLRWIEQPKWGQWRHDASLGYRPAEQDHIRVFDSDRICSWFGTAYDDMPTKWEEHIATASARVRP